MARKFIPSPAQQDFFDWVTEGSGNCILEAVAGAGKTTTILEGIARMRGRVWFGVYNKKMADEIKEKMADRPELVARRGKDGVFTSTFHSAGFSAWRNQVKGVQVDDKKVDRIVEELILEKEGVSNQERPDLRAMQAAIPRIVSMAKNQGFGVEGLQRKDDMDAWADMVSHFSLDEDLPDEVNLDTVVRFAIVALNRSRKERDVVDFDDMIYMPLAFGARFFKHEWVLVDEAQDTNPTRRMLARQLLAPKGRFVAVGDPHQAIFGFTGADNDSLDLIARDFRAMKLPLTVTYRCPKAVVAHAQSWVGHITAHESAPDGQVLIMPYEDVLAQLPNVPRAQLSETAILCRYNKYLVTTCFKLLRAGVAAKIEGRAIGEGLLKLATRWKSIKTLNGLETKLKEYMQREVDKALKKQQEAKADRVTDQVETLLVIMDRARAQGVDRVTDLRPVVEDLFDDNTAGKSVLTLCSAHKSKGLEWDTVYLLGREQFMPSKMAKQDWQFQQEDNLIYVAVTRAKNTLVEVTAVPDGDDKRPSEKEAA